MVLGATLPWRVPMDLLRGAAIFLSPALELVAEGIRSTRACRGLCKREAPHTYAQDASDPQGSVERRLQKKGSDDPTNIFILD